MKTPQEIQTMLEAPFAPEQIKQREGSHGRMLPYVDGATVYRRLNEACNQWSFEIASSGIEEMYSRDGDIDRVMVVSGHLIVPELGKRPGYGVQALRPGGGEDQFKAALTDAIKKAATLFGVALQLYEDHPMQGQSTVSPLHDRTNDADRYRQQQQQQQPGGGNYQRSSGDRVPGGATVRQIAQIEKSSGQLGWNHNDLADFLSRFNASPDLDQLNSKLASDIISALFAEVDAAKKAQNSGS